MLLRPLLPQLEQLTFCFDVERRSTESEERGVEHDGAVAVERHVHRHQTLQQHHPPYSTAASQRTSCNNTTHPTALQLVNAQARETVLEHQLTRH